VPHPIGSSIKWRAAGRHRCRRLVLHIGPRVRCRLHRARQGSWRWRANRRGARPGGRLAFGRGWDCVGGHVRSGCRRAKSVSVWSEASRCRRRPRGWILIHAQRIRIQDTRYKKNTDSTTRNVYLEGLVLEHQISWEH
jgi:hypothetical protein